MLVVVMLLCVVHLMCLSLLVSDVFSVVFSAAGGAKGMRLLQDSHGVYKLFAEMLAGNVQDVCKGVCKGVCRISAEIACGDVCNTLAKHFPSSQDVHKRS